MDHELALACLPRVNLAVKKDSTASFVLLLQLALGCSSSEFCGVIQSRLSAQRTMLEILESETSDPLKFSTQRQLSLHIYFASEGFKHDVVSHSGREFSCHERAWTSRVYSRTRSNTSPTSDTSQTPSSCFLETWKSHLKSTFCTRSSLYKQLDGRLICLCFCKAARSVLVGMNYDACMGEIM